MVVPLILGIDPDTKTTGWAVLSLGGLEAVGVIRADGLEGMIRHTGVVLPSILKRWAAHLAVVEGQQIYSGSKAAHASILTLCTAAGATHGQISLLAPDVKIIQPLPADWKGQTPKQIDQARSYAKVGLPYEQGKDYAWPTRCDAVGAASLRKSDWKHVGDAVGLALHGLKTLGF